MKLLCKRVALPALLLLTTAGVEAFSFFDGAGRAAGLRPSSTTRRPSPQHYADHVGRMAVRMAAEAKNASEISHDNVVEYREKLSIIPRANGEDGEVRSYE